MNRINDFSEFSSMRINESNIDRFLKLVQKSDNKITLDQITVQSTQKGNLRVYVDNKDFGLTLNGNILTDFDIDNYDLRYFGNIVESNKIEKKLSYIIWDVDNEYYTQDGYAKSIITEINENNKIYKIQHNFIYDKITNILGHDAHLINNNKISEYYENNFDEYQNLDEYKHFKVLSIKDVQKIINDVEKCGYLKIKENNLVLIDWDDVINIYK